MKSSDSSFTRVLLGFGALLVAVFLGHLAWRGMHRFPDRPQWEVAGGDAERGRETITRYGCAACHVIPDIHGPRGRVGPKLEDFRNQIYIAGKLPNTPDNLVLWILEPDQVTPGTAMPDLGLSEQEARDVAAYIFAHP